MNLYLTRATVPTWGLARRFPAHSSYWSRRTRRRRSRLEPASYRRSIVILHDLVFSGDQKTSTSLVCTFRCRILYKEAWCRRRRKGCVVRPPQDPFLCIFAWIDLEGAFVEMIRVPTSKKHVTIDGSHDWPKSVMGRRWARPVFYLAAFQRPGGQLFYSAASRK